MHSVIRHDYTAPRINLRHLCLSGRVLRPTPLRRMFFFRYQLIIINSCCTVLYRVNLFFIFFEKSFTNLAFLYLKNSFIYSRRCFYVFYNTACKTSPKTHHKVRKLPKFWVLSESKTSPRSYDCRNLHALTSPHCETKTFFFNLRFFIVMVA